MTNEPEMRLHLKCYNCLMESDIETRGIAAATSVAPCETHGFHAQVELAVFCPHCEKENINILTDFPEDTDVS